MFTAICRGDTSATRREQPIDAFQSGIRTNSFSSAPRWRVSKRRFKQSFERSAGTAWKPEQIGPEREYTDGGKI
jgi:hypothetical protein